MRRARIFRSAAVLLRCQKTSFLVVMMIGLMLMPVMFLNAESDSSYIGILSATEPLPSIRRIEEDPTAAGDTRAEGEGITAPADNESNGQEPHESNDKIDTTDEVPVPTGTDEASPTKGDAAAAETEKSPGDLQTDTTDTGGGGGEEEGATPEPTPAPVTAPVADDNNNNHSSAPTTSKGGTETATKESPEEKNDPGAGGGGEEDGGAEENITSNPTQAPTKKELISAPVLSPVDPPVPKDDDPDGGDQDPCGDATTCELCTEQANQLDSQEWTCWWTDDARCVKMTKEAHEYDERCPEDIPPPPVGKPTGGDNNYAWDDDNESMMPLLLGLVGIAIVVFLLYRKLCSSQILAGGHAISEHGKYQGLSTAEKDEDEEWGWDDEPQSRRSRQVEMVQTTPRSSGKGSAYHRRSRSPNSATERVAESSFESSAPPLKRGLAVKRSGGLKNPLHAKQQQQESTTPAPPPPASPPKPVRPAAPVVKKQAVQADDFFEDFGFAASSAAGKAKSKSSAAAVSKPPSAGLGATRLTADTAAGKDDWGDDDLDDLLDD